jgi:hypothetical protein
VVTVAGHADTQAADPASTAPPGDPASSSGGQPGASSSRCPTPAPG